MTGCSLQVQLDGRNYTFGDTIKGTARIYTPKKLTVSGIEVGLVCTESAVVQLPHLQDTDITDADVRETEPYRNMIPLCGKTYLLAGEQTFQFELQIPPVSSNGDSPYPATMIVPSSKALGYSWEKNGGSCLVAAAEVKWNVQLRLIRSRFIGSKLITDTLENIRIFSAVGSIGPPINSRDFRSESRSEELQGLPAGDFLKCTLTYSASGIWQPGPNSFSVVVGTTTRHLLRVSRVTLSLEEVVTTGFTHEGSGRTVQEIHNFTHPLYTKSFAGSLSSCNLELEQDLARVFVLNPLYPSAQSLFSRRDYILTVSASARTSKGISTTVKVEAFVDLHPAPF